MFEKLFGKKETQTSEKIDAVTFPDQAARDARIIAFLAERKLPPSVNGDDEDKRIQNMMRLHTALALEIVGGFQLDPKTMPPDRRAVFMGILSIIADSILRFGGFKPYWPTLMAGSTGCILFTDERTAKATDQMADLGWKQFTQLMKHPIYRAHAEVIGKGYYDYLYLNDLTRLNPVPEAVDILLRTAKTVIS